MAQFDVYKPAGQAGAHSLLLDIQSDLIGLIDSRVVVPLVKATQAPALTQRLNPVFVVNQQKYVALFQDLQSVTLDMLGARVGNLAEKRFEVTNTLDFLFQDY
jgi:toxin CcdB